MSPEQWAEVERLFQFAADLAPLERRIFLDRECPDADMRQEVLSLLQHAGEEPRPAEAAIASAVLCCKVVSRSPRPIMSFVIMASLTGAIWCYWPQKPPPSAPASHSRKHVSRSVGKKPSGKRIEVPVRAGQRRPAQNR